MVIASRRVETQVTCRQRRDRPARYASRHVFCIGEAVLCTGEAVLCIGEAILCTG